MSSRGGRAGGNLSVDDLAAMMKDQKPEALEQRGGLKGVADALGANLDQGVSNDVEQRRQNYGENKMPAKPMKSFFSFVWEAVQDKTLIILMVCAAISIVLGLTVEKEGTGWIDGVVIFVAISLVVMVTAGNDYNKEKKFQKLNEVREEKQITVRRGGSNTSISDKEIVVGDIIELDSGATIPADALYIKGQNFSVDESPMTGESESVRKSEKKPYLLSGCMVMEGVCSALVVAVGPNSQRGKITALLQGPSEDTPLTTKLDKMANQIGKFGLTAAGLTLVALLGRWGIEFYQAHRSFDTGKDLSFFVTSFITAITIVVMAVPEGLPLAVTISLAYSMIKMMKDQNLVRHLEACETMGGATNICSDKTGTLTQNRMTVHKVWIAGKESTASAAAKDANAAGPSSRSPAPAQQRGDSGKTGAPEADQKVLTLVTEGISVNSTAYIQNKDGKKDFVGNKTECALLEYIGNDMKTDYNEVRTKLKANIVKLIPFSSDRKMMSTVIKSEQGQRVYTKGASEMVLKICTEMLDADGSTKPIDEKQRAEFGKLIESFASEGLRTISLAYKDLSGSESNFEDKDFPSGGLVFIGITGIKDPVRKEVPPAVKKCQDAGIMVRMITGDNILTAKFIAKECGILTEGGEAMEGPAFRALSTAELDRVIPKLQVIARAAPEDKYILVHRLRELGEVVAVTGDGVNDAPQLKEADVGFAMGITGTEVAKEASDIVLLDDNFSSIVKALMWGRNVYGSIRKFIQFQLTVNVVAVCIAFIGAVSEGQSPLTAVQLLWVNLIMDTFAALALATEVPNEVLLKDKPYGRFDSLITRKMWRNIIGQALYQLGVLLFLLYGVTLVPFFGVSKSDATENDNLEKNTMIFNTFVLCQLFNEINARKLGNEKNVFEGIFKNYIFLGVQIITLVGQFLMVQFGGEFVHTTPLSPQQWAISAGIGAISLVIGFLLRFIPITEPPPKKRPTTKEEHAELTGEHESFVKGKGRDRDLEAGERVSLIEKTPETGRAQRRSGRMLWGEAHKVVTEVGVVNALRKGGIRNKMSYHSKRNSIVPSPAVFRSPGYSPRNNVNSAIV